jgi:hypothetical protein
VALRRGSVPELVMPGQTGVIVDHPDELADAIVAARKLDPVLCRKHVEAGFATGVMAAGYEAVYRRTLDEPVLLPVSRAAAIRAAN